MRLSQPWLTRALYIATSLLTGCELRHPLCIDPTKDGKLTGTLCCTVICSPDGKVEIQTGWWYAGYQCIPDKAPPITIDCLNEYDKMCNPVIGCPP